MDLASERTECLRASPHTCSIQGRSIKTTHERVVKNACTPNATSTVQVESATWLTYNWHHKMQRQTRRAPAHLGPRLTFPRPKLGREPWRFDLFSLTVFRSRSHSFIMNSSRFVRKKTGHHKAGFMPLMRRGQLTCDCIHRFFAWETVGSPQISYSP